MSKQKRLATFQVDLDGFSTNLDYYGHSDNLEKDVKERISDFLSFLKKNYDGKSIAIVAHKAPQLALDVVLKHISWQEAFEKDWRKTKSWQPGWEYSLE